MEDIMQRGLSAMSKTNDEIVRIDDKTAIRYRVVEERIDLEALRQEKENLQTQLDVPEPTKEELIEMGRMMHPYYQGKDWIANRIKEIDNILGK